MPEIAHHRRKQRSVKWSQFDPEFLPLWVADMDFKICPTITSSLQDSIKNETFGYTQQWPEVNEAVIHWCKQHYDWEIQTDWIVWLPGIVPAFHLVNQLFCDNDQTILIPSPNYPPLLNSAKNLQKTCQFVPHVYSGQEKRWHLDFDALEHLLKNNAVGILSIANPANPLGYMLNTHELNKLKDLCAEHNVIICSDEIHCDLTYGKKHIPMGKVAPNRSITLMAASKTFNIAGLNTAFAIIPNKKHRETFKAAAHHRIGSPTLLGLTATEAAFKHGEPWRLDTMQYLQKNRDLINTWALDNDLNSHYLPQATHLYWLEIKSKQWINNKVMPSKGADFGDAQFSRINFACDRELLIEALQRMS